MDAMLSCLNIYFTWSLAGQKITEYFNGGYINAKVIFQVPAYR